MLASLTSPYVVGVSSRLTLQVLSFAQILIASRFLDLGAFGVYALGWAVSVIFVTFLFTGYYHALLRSPDFERDRDTTFWMILAIGLISAVVLAVTGLVAGGAGNPTGETFLLLAALPLIKAPTAWNEALLMCDRRVRTVSCYLLLGELLATIVLYLGLQAGLGVPAMVLGRYVAAFTDLVVLALVVRILPAFHIRSASVIHGWKTARPLWVTTGVGTFTNYGADMILGAFLNTAAVGAYRGGARISQTVSDLVMQPLLVLSWSRFPRLEKEGRTEELRESWLQMMSLGAASLWPILMCFALYADDIVTLIFADLWGPVAPILVIICGARAAYFLSILLEPTLVCRNRASAQLRLRAFGAVLLLASLLAFGRESGEAAAYAFGGTSLIVGVISMYLMMQELRISLPRVLRAFLPALVITLLCVVATEATVDIRATMDRVAAFAASVTGLAALWVLCIGLCIRFKILKLPVG